LNGTLYSQDAISFQTTFDNVSDVSNAPGAALPRLQKVPPPWFSPNIFLGE
jgi:hypothetical protein